MVGIRRSAPPRIVAKSNSSDREVVGRKDAHLDSDANPVTSQLHTKKPRRAATFDPIAISSSMTTNEIVGILRSHRCPDITHRLDVENCGAFPVGFGGFGDVYEGKLVSGEKVAIKCARLFVSSTEGLSQTTKILARELYSWSKCKNPNVLELFGLARFRNQIAIISPWMDNGTLPSYIAKTPEADVYDLCYQVTCGVAYLHERDTIHGDIKGANILISDDGIAKLSDFGNTILGERSLRFTGSNNESLSLRWTAPELLSGKGGFSQPADVYALGMTILEAITGSVPFHEKSDQAVVVDVMLHKKCPTRSEKYFPGQENKLWAMLKDCWQPDAKSRLQAAQVKDQLRDIIRAKQETSNELGKESTDTSC